MGPPDTADQPWRHNGPIRMRSLLVIPLLLTTAPAAFAQTEEQKHQQCIEKIDQDAEAAYQDGLSWLARGNRPAARHCTALALIALGQEAEGAARLEELANAPDGGTLDERGVYLVQSGNAWLMAGMPDAAVVTLTATGIDCRVCSRLVAVTMISLPASAAGCAFWAKATAGRTRPTAALATSAGLMLVARVLWLRALRGYTSASS